MKIMCKVQRIYLPVCKQEDERKHLFISWELTGTPSLLTYIDSAAHIDSYL